MDERDSFRRPSQCGCDGAQAFAERNAHASAPADPADTALSLARILVLPGADEDAAERLGAKIGVAPLRDECVLDPSDLVVRFDADGVSLQRGGLSMRADLAAMLPRLKAGRLNRELLVRAARIKGAQVGESPLRAVDATAGLGEDALLLAAAGFEVMLFERDPVIAALLADSLRRAREHPQLADAASRMHLVGADSVEAMPAIDPAPDVVYLDPMFPERRKSAAVKKKFQLIHYLEHPCDDQEALMRAALAAHPRKVVVKRPVKGPHLAGIKPSYSLAGKSVRYDCIVPVQ